jgi:two-component system sensor histidine kinase KdpD
MAAVHGAAETLLRQDITLSPENERRLLEMIAGQAARLGQITEQVLLATQLDHRAVSVEREHVDVAELARTVIEALRPRFPETTVVDLEVEPGVGAAVGAPDRIQQVLVNLLDNALKYGEGRITVRVEATSGSVRVSVADSGPGLTPAEQERIFEKFYRGGHELTRASGGTGLGLYISKELIEQMGGRLFVRADPGAGATFTVELPRA